MGNEPANSAFLSFSEIDIGNQLKVLSHWIRCVAVCHGARRWRAATRNATWCRSAL